MSARSEVLGRIRAALPVRPAAQPPRHERRPEGPPTADGGEDLLSLFADRVRDYRAEVRTVAEADLGQVLRDVAREQGASRLAIAPDLPADLRAALAGLAVVDDPPLPVRVLDELDGAVTTCAVAIAETGTIVLDAGAGQGRRVLTLVPDLHVVLVRADQVRRGIGAALAALDPARPLTWISGPSATSDIELSRVEGVHGPRRLVVLLTCP